MLKNLFRANFFTTGLAMFSMFFGSGNLIFPVGVGQVAGDQNIWAMAGLFITAVFLPFFTLGIMLLFDGDYRRFFQKIGVVPGKIIAFAILGLIGPFGVLPRCIAFSYSTFSIYFPEISLVHYSLVACVIVFFMSVKQNDVVGLLGNFLTPLLIVALVVVICQGLSADHVSLQNEAVVSNWSMFQYGFIEGYKTFDIFAALFFATAIIPAFHNVLGNDLSKCKKSLMKLAFYSSLVGGFFLLAVYAGLSFTSANLRGVLVGVPGDRLLGVISTLTMGDAAGLVANAVVSLACLTTAITLAVVSAEFFKRDVFFYKVSYFNCLLLTMIISLAFSLMGFDGIMMIVIPALKVICPAVIMLILVNTLNYFYGFKIIKTPVYVVFALSLLVTIAF